jgi:thioredoxin reductase/pSer/pThr/pTyr-binding forkhead associated (FHA) protein
MTEVLDVLVVGGGPAGTAAAFRAKELGLRALVIDFDDLLKRIRDYPKDKLILPDFGGGDRIAFPAGGDCVSALQFGPIDKDEICARWKGFYESFGIPARTGIEISGVERDGDVWRVRTWDLRKVEQVDFRARHVVLAIGRGVPRRLDIAGNLDGIAYRLDDPARYVAGPVLVVGGGTSAAEAVVAISGAKIATGEPCAVYWAFRGTKMPTVSRALAERFFEAFIGNGNIRSLPDGEPVSVVTGPDRSELLSVRIDRRTSEGRPPETMHLEFSKTHCIACIGEDIPEGFLRSLGILMVEAAEFKKMLVTPLLETQQENIYLIGDLLAPSYLEVDRFDSSPGTYGQVKHRGNIKTSLRDGVMIAEVIKQRLEGRASVDVVIGDATPIKAPSRNSRAVSVLALTSAATVGSLDVRGDGSSVEGASLVLVTPTGIEADEFRLGTDGATTLGRIDCDVSFPQDTSLSDSHASISCRDGEFFLRDDGSRSGTYLKLRPEKPMLTVDGDLFRVGRQILVVTRQIRGEPPQVEHYDATGTQIGRYPIRGTTVFGRSGAEGLRKPNVILDDRDGTLTRFHMSMTFADDVLYTEDFRSKNGTYLRVSAERKLEHGDIVRIGSQLLTVRLREDLPTKRGSKPVPVVERERVPGEVPAQPAPARVPVGVGASDGRSEPHIVVAGQNISGATDSRTTLLKWALANVVAIDSDCEVGKCGLDVIRILSGGEYLNAVTESEIQTLKRDGISPGTCRLACMTKTSGPVVIEVVT